MMLEMKRVVLLLSVVLLTCAAPLHQNNELSSSQESQVTSRVTQFRGNSGSDIIIKAPAGFGKPNEKGQSTVTVSLRDENTNVSIDVVSFIFSVNSEEMSDAEVGESNGGFSDEGVQDINAGPEEKIIDNDEEMSEEGFDPTAGPEVLNGDKDLDKSEEETPDPKDNKSGEDQIHSTSSQSETRVDSEVSDQEHSNVFETTATSDTSSKQEDSNESEHQKTKSNSAEPSAQHLSGQLTSLRLVLASSFVDQETTSSEANAKGTNSKLDISSVEGQTVPTISESMLGPFQKASELSSSSEEKTDDEYKNSVADPTPSKSPSLNSHPESMVNTKIMKKNDALLAPLFSGSDVYPEYVNDWQYDPRYYDLYRNHPGYAAGYDPYGAGYDPYAAGYDPYAAGYDPYQAGYDPYGAGYDPYQAGYDPYGEGYDPYRAGYDPYGAGYDPYGAGYDPYQAGYDNQDPYHKTESEDPRHAVEQETTAYSVEENESRPTEISNIQDNSYSEEQPQSPSISPSSTPVSLPEGSENIPSEQPSNSSSIETSREMQLLPSKGANDFNGPPDPAVSDSEEGTETGADAVGKKMAATGSFSSEESAETTDSEQDSQNPMDQPAKQGTPDPAIQTSSHMSVVQLSPDIQEAHNEEEPQSQSPVALIPAFSSEEDEPLANTIEHIMALAFSSETNEEGKNPDSTRLDNTFSKNNQNEESYSNESATDSPRISAEVTREPVHLTTESPPFDSESAPTSDSLVSNEDASSEKITPNPSTNLHITQSSGGLVEANANNAKDSEESQESQIFTSSTAFPIASQPAQEQYTENSSDEENTQDRKSNQGIISQFPVETSAKIIATNLWTSFLQALKVPIANPSRQAFQKNARRPQSTRRYHQRSNRRQKANSSEESK
ncbi:protein SON-like [Hemibagrus wyckioides]|uniref:protein SON-like n=1 Tax=Hemibagrus wyckioides TaxID=337641 RepID=UPI00266BC356|nr:protein SON-like [Hemibagrus wyckioides]